jgi:hypothetical protein
LSNLGFDLQRARNRTTLLVTQQIFSSLCHYTVFCNHLALFLLSDIIQSNVHDSIINLIYWNLTKSKYAEVNLVQSITQPQPFLSTPTSVIFFPIRDALLVKRFEHYTRPLHN